MNDFTEKEDIHMQKGIISSQQICKDENNSPFDLFQLLFILLD
jgi:hypothetical protein